MGVGDKNVYFARFDYGRKDYLFGNLIIWEILRVLFHMSKKPFVIGGLLMMLGFISEYFRRTKRPMDKDVLEFHRKEQKKKLIKILKRPFSRDHKFSKRPKEKIW